MFASPAESAGEFVRSSWYGPIIFLCKLFTHFPSYFIFSKQIHLIQRHTDIFFFCFEDLWPEHQQQNCQFINRPYPLVCKTSSGEFNAWQTRLPQVLLRLVLVVLVVQAVPQYCSHPVPVYPISKALQVETPFTKYYISHRFLRKNEIHTLSPEVLGHPSPLLDPACD